MSILTIKNWLDPVLRKKGEPIENIDGSIAKLTEDMIETTLNAKGAGLAANQVGLPYSLFVVDMGIEKGTHDLIAVVNPVITATEGEEISEEGCLSIPEVYAQVKRALKVELKGLDLDGNPIRYEAKGFLARAFQHEMDHLDGSLFWDKLGKLKRDSLKRKFKKKQKELEA
ncbi:MAG: peptide deformylase [Nitrospinaceae bacterium]|nr:MAG: peptide deformylase [Nitrospinaceae bacterium]